MVAGLTVSVGTTAVNLTGGLGLHQYEVLIRTPDGGLGVDLFLGGPAVSGTDGFQVSRQANQTYRLTLHGDSLYAVTTGGTGTIHVLAYEVGK